jgi:hypothetical protein
MAVVMMLFAVGLGIAAARTKDRILRYFWGGAAALNVVAAVAMIVDRDEYVFRLRPDDGSYERDFRR